ncbi:MAG TPA: hypothetical protein VNZ54_02370 [bacterium]|nr:hypothetical protein [bacterium]
MPPQPHYQRLPGSFRPLSISGLGSENSARGYLAEDHLLLLGQGPYSETTRHVYFEDILAIGVSSHWESKAWGWFSGVGVAACLGVMASVPNETAALVALGILAALFALVGALNLWLGPSCRCRMLTAGGWRHLGLWDRWPAARRGLAVLVPRLEAVQVPLSGAAPVGEAVAAPAPTAKPEPAAAGPVAGPLPHHASGALALSALLFLFSAGYDSTIFLPALDWSTDLSTTFTYAAWAGACVALALSLRGGRRAVGAGVGGLVAVALQYVLAAAQTMALTIHLEGLKRAPVNGDLRAYIHQPAVLFCYASATLVGVLAGGLQLWASSARGKRRA